MQDEKMIQINLARAREERENTEFMFCNLYLTGVVDALRGVLED